MEVPAPAVAEMTADERTVELTRDLFSKVRVALGHSVQKRDTHLYSRLGDGVWQRNGRALAFLAMYSTWCWGQVGALLESELQKGGEDFTLLEQMNLVTTAKYRCAAQF